jgi:hypothetical protein
MNAIHVRRAGLALALLLVPGIPGVAAAQEEAPAAAPASAPAAIEPVEVYRREVFTYQRTGRPDPFQPLTGGAELAIRPEDLQLSGLIYSGNPRESVANFIVPGTDRRIRLRTGERFGALTVLSIYPGHVNVRVDEFGNSRIYSIQLQRRRFDNGQPRAVAAEQDGDPTAAEPRAQAQQQPQQDQPPTQVPAAPQRRGSRAAQTSSP